MEDLYDRENDEVIPAPKEKNMTKKVHAEIEYQKEDGTWIHSDICPSKCDFNNLDDEHKKFLHDCLDEWLEKGNGTGIFYIANNDHQVLGGSDDPLEKELGKNFILIPRG